MGVDMKILIILALLLLPSCYDAVHSDFGTTTLTIHVIWPCTAYEADDDWPEDRCMIDDNGQVVPIGDE